ncbi:MAG: glycine cleavage system protein H [Deltaproteobacteria bacterium]|nr:glycine cleavage system protein H [Deltaproteobacteria bacterium]
MAVISGYNLPDDLYYTDEHAWARVEGARVRVGLNDFAQKLAGEISFVKLPKPGKEAAVDKVLFSLQSGKWAGKIKSPVGGTVAEVNEDLTFEPGKINQDCYGEGWVALIEPVDLEADRKALIFGADAVSEWVAREIAAHPAPKG